MIPLEESRHGIVENGTSPRARPPSGGARAGSWCSVFVSTYWQKPMLKVFHLPAWHIVPEGQSA